MATEWARMMAVAQHGLVIMLAMALLSPARPLCASTSIAVFRQGTTQQGQSTPARLALDSYCGELAALDPLNVVVPDSVQGLLLLRGVNLDMVSPSEIGALLKADYLVGATLNTGKRSLTLTLRVYDIRSRKMMSAITDTSPLDRPGIIGMARMLALETFVRLPIADSSGEYLRQRDSLIAARREEITAPFRTDSISRARLQEINRQVRHEMRTQDLRAAAATTAALAAAGLGIVFNNRAVECFGDARTGHDAYLDARAEFTQAWQKVSDPLERGRSAIRMRNICYVASAVCGGAAATIFWLRMRKAKRLRASLNLSWNGAGATVTAARW